MLRDDDSFPRSGSMFVDARVGDMSQDHVDISRDGTFENDDLDDVFGSYPGSPNPDREAHQSNQFYEGANANVEVSDIPRLKKKHETEGYRDGVTRGKAESVQAGFDEGYGLGAVIGLRIGKMLGLIEGILGAVVVAAKDNGHAEDDKKWEDERERLKNLWKEARVDLKTESVFQREWWGDDGIWSFDVPGQGPESDEVVFTDIAGAHPLIRKWEGIIEAESRRWRIDPGLMDSVEESREVDEATKPHTLAEGPEHGATQDLAW